MFGEGSQPYFIDSFKKGNKNVHLAFFNKKNYLHSKERNLLLMRARTFLNNNVLLEFRAELIGADTIGFKENIYKTIQSIQIKE